MEGNASSRTDILNGWKEISTYLRMGIRNVQRYEDFGLPVRRPAGRQKGTVLATKAELDSWITARPIREIPRPPALTMRRSTPWTDFKSSLAEMKRLRGEVIRLREDAVASLEVLHGKVLFMQGSTSGKLVEFPNARNSLQIEGLESDSISNWLLEPCEQEASQPFGNRRSFSAHIGPEEGSAEAKRRIES